MINIDRELVLVVDDEENILELMQVYLQKEGFCVSLARDGEEALIKIKKEKPALVVLDIMLPNKDGWEICREARQFSQVPIIMLTARGEEFDRILGLELGADDYMTKPFSPRELVARIKAVLRRVSAHDAAIPALKEEPEIISFPGFELNSNSREVKRNDNEIVLTPKEFELVWFLAAHPRKVFTRQQLLSEVWGQDYYGDLRTVDTHIKRLREKIRPGGKSAGFDIKTVWGVGYKFDVLE